MNFRQVEAFRTVIATGSVTAAASTLRISQPAVSKLLAQLERATGLVLFERSKNRLEPTREARVLYEEVERVFIGLDRIRQTVEGIRNLTTGHLHIGSIPALTLGFLPRVIKRFRQHYPHVTFTLASRESMGVQGWVFAQEYDLGLIANFTDTASVAAELFAETPGVCLFPRGHPLEALSAVRPADLAPFPLILVTPEYAARRRIDSLFERQGLRPQMVLETTQTAAVAAMVLEGLGVGIVNWFTARDYVHQGLAARPFQPTVAVRFMLLRPHQRPLSRLAARFIEVLKAARDEELADDRWMKPDPPASPARVPREPAAPGSNRLPSGPAGR